MLAMNQLIEVDYVSNSSLSDEDELSSSHENTIIGNDSFKQKSNDVYLESSFNKLELNDTELNVVDILYDDIQSNNYQLSSTENKINNKREDVLLNTITPIFLRLLREEDFEFGY